MKMKCQKSLDFNMANKKYRARKRRVGCFLPSCVYMCICSEFLDMPAEVENRNVVVSEAEMPRWKQLGIEYMCDEYDNDDTPVVIVHSPPWCSVQNVSCILYAPIVLYVVHVHVHVLVH